MSGGDGVVDGGGGCSGGSGGGSGNGNSDYWTLSLLWKKSNYILFLSYLNCLSLWMHSLFFVEERADVDIYSHSM